MSNILTPSVNSVFSLEKKTFRNTPLFENEQIVYFLGGMGRIKDCKPFLGTWIYFVEMEFGPEPECGRIGDETTILLTESEICH